MEKIISSIFASDDTYTYEHKSHKEKGLAYKPHHHNGYEIFILLKGDGVFLVEGTSYPLKPMDIIIANASEIHEISYEKEIEYERVVVHLTDAFFEQLGCTHYTEIFNNRKSGENNLIDREPVKKSKLFDTLRRLDKYVKAKDDKNDAVIRATIVELLHQLNQFKTTDGEIMSNAVKNVIEYINENIAENLALSHLAEKFFMSKYHLCRSFKKYTGFTVNQYITYRRIMIAKELHASGKNLSDASIEAGFASYSNFYKAYVKETGHAPSEDSDRKK